MTTPASARPYRVLGRHDLVMNALADVGWWLAHDGFDPDGLPPTLVLSRTPSDSPEGA